MKLSERSRKRPFAALALACALCAGTFAMVHADALYILTGAGGRERVAEHEKRTLKKSALLRVYHNCFFTTAL